ncbi:Uma2 family endonuclease [Polyangium mundeleinium]|uniref:Uma2 family endonuclease n=1 Tax=Polyangium mundeleinium TaxID=2995306 RepID=A0ABT5F622_9BACT|nr:Uma2 family endonuclease [Polyangium mundeleinium]MDC0749554.1 Uma2 family endonuclease [Polyangium mundeleinium]
MTSLAISTEPKAEELPDDLPPDDLWSDQAPMESTEHLAQITLLLESIELFWKDRTDFFAAGDLTIYFSPKQLKNEKFNGPDFFVVLGAERKPRRSWTVWHEGGLYPNVIVEVLSPSTRKLDQGLKKQVYQDVFRTPEYFWFDPETKEFAGFELVKGRYTPLEPDASGRLWSAQLGLFLGVHADKLRFFTKEGALVPTGRERAESEHERAEAEHARAARLAEKLRALGVDPDKL